MGISECRNDCGFCRSGGFNLIDALDIDKTTVDAVTATKEGINSVESVDFVRCNDVLAERLNGSPVGECSGCSECLH